MGDLYEHLARQERGRAHGHDGGINMASGSTPMRLPGLAPAQGLLADEISRLLEGREDRGRHDGFQAGYESGSTDARRQAQHSERRHIEVVLDMLRVELRSVGSPLAAAGELLRNADAARAAAKTPKERAKVKEAIARATELVVESERRLTRLLSDEIPSFTRRVLEDGLPL